MTLQGSEYLREECVYRQIHEADVNRFLDKGNDLRKTRPQSIFLSGINLICAIAYLLAQPFALLSPQRTEARQLRQPCCELFVSKLF